MTQGQYIYNTQVSTAAQGNLFYDGSVNLYINQVESNGINLAYFLNPTLQNYTILYVITSALNGYTFKVNGAPVLTGSSLQIPVTLVDLVGSAPTVGTFVNFSAINSIINASDFDLQGARNSNPSSGQVITWSSGIGWINANPASSGTVTSLTAGTGITLTPNPIVGAGTIAITPSGVTGAGTAHTITTLTWNAEGQITAFT